MPERLPAMGHASRDPTAQPGSGASGGRRRSVKLRSVAVYDRGPSLQPRGGMEGDAAPLPLVGQGEHIPRRPVCITDGHAGSPAGHGSDSHTLSLADSILGCTPSPRGRDRFLGEKGIPLIRANFWPGYRRENRQARREHGGREEKSAADRGCQGSTRFLRSPLSAPPGRLSA
jgi:hypothetical protein